jgi:imidazolonepropionase-like amidohydrolase
MGKFIITIFCSFISLNLPSQSVYIKAGEVFNGMNFIGSKIISVKGGLITGIYDEDYQVPEGFNLINATNCTILPGLIDSHLHFMGAALPYISEIEKYSFGRLASEGLSLFPEHRRQLILNGITTIIDMGAPLKCYQKIRKAALEYKILGPEIYYPGPLITAPDGHPVGTIYKGQHDLILNGTMQVSDDSKARKEIDNLSYKKVDFIKIIYDRAWYLNEGVPRLDFGIAKAITEEAHKLGLKVIAHVGSEEEAWDMINIDVDGVEHGFKISSDSILIAFRDQNISFTPTLTAYDHYAPEAVKFMEETINRASLLGVPLTVGTDYPGSYGISCGEDLYKEIRHLEQSGISRTNVLRGATSYGARKIGKENEIGYIREGYRANLVFYEGLVDTGELNSLRVLKTMINGSIIAENGRIVPEYKSFFKTRNTIVFPYGYYDVVSGMNIGMNYTNFNLFKTGTSLFADLALSTKNMCSGNLQFFFPSPLKKTSLKASFHFDNLNRLFYGIGNNSLPENQTEYISSSMRECVSASMTLTKNWNLLHSITLDQFKFFGLDNLNSSNVGLSGGNQTILALSLIFDTRDHQNNPWTGLMISFTPELSSTLLGSKNDFGRITFDARGYISPIPKNTFCSRILFRQALGNVPFYLMPDFGGETIGRGYITSRFINRSGLYFQAEYRFPIWKIISCVAFFDAGQVQETPKGMKLSSFHQNIGLGPRFSFGSNENSILGLDLGFSKETMMVQFHAGHSF